MTHQMIRWTLERADEQLQAAWLAVRELLPPALQRTALKLALVKSFEELYLLFGQFLDEVIELAIVLPSSNPAYFGERAKCPLCGHESLDPYLRGFAYPNGLLGHLEGRGKMQRCPVTEALRDMAIRNIRHEAEEAIHG